MPDLGHIKAASSTRDCLLPITTDSNSSSQHGDIRQKLWRCLHRDYICTSRVDGTYLDVPSPQQKLHKVKLEKSREGLFQSTTDGLASMRIQR
jgi:hypothetical protein